MFTVRKNPFLPTFWLALTKYFFIFTFLSLIPLFYFLKCTIINMDHARFRKYILLRA